MPPEAIRVMKNIIVLLNQGLFAGQNVDAIPEAKMFLADVIAEHEKAQAEAANEPAQA
jgi:hypothetical protein